MSAPAPPPVDLLVIGGGIQGTAIARDAAGRGLSVLLVEQGDLAGATSSASSKLAHGGLRYLEQGRLRLVREALLEREILLRTAPHLVRPLRLLLPHVPGLRPGWWVRAGLLLYDRLARGSSLPASRPVRLLDSPYGEGLRPELTRGFLTSDGRVDDQRLVIANARAAAAGGATILTHTALRGAERAGPLWRARLQQVAADGEARPPDGGERCVSARVLVNAAGPWAGRLLQEALPHRGAARVRPVRGSHLVLPRLLPGDHGLVLPLEDGRIIFVLPFEEDLSLVGTTEVPHPGDPKDARASDDEVAYLCRAASRFLAAPVRPDQVLATFAGVRPLYDDGRADPSKVGREDVLEVEHEQGAAPLLTVFGGKLTTARRIAERVLEALEPWLPTSRGPWTAGAPLPGGELPPGGPPALLEALRREHPALPAACLVPLARRHGSEAAALLAGAREPDDLGPELAPGLFAREVDWMVDHEWARTGEDVLRRRSWCGLRADLRQREAVAAAVAARRARRTADRPGAARPGAGPGRR